MIPLQEICVHVGESIFQVHLVKIGREAFEAEIVCPPLVNEQSRTLWRQEPPYEDAMGSFKWAMSKLRDFCDKWGLQIDRVDNPCNAEFLSRTEQANVLRTLAPNAEILVNGNRD